MVRYKRKVFDILQIGHSRSKSGRFFDLFIAAVIFVNLFCTLFSTFEESAPYKDELYMVEFLTIVIFSVEYALRIWTADLLYPKMSRGEARVAFMLSFFGLIDLLTIVIFFLPMFFSAGTVAFRMLRVVRIFQLFKANQYYDSFSVITDVLREKRDQIFSSVFLILVLMIASSLTMYSLEHDVQPDKFENAFSGIWWAVSTLLTVGYGDIYPITTLGKVMAIIISFLGVGMVAIPTGIISAGFVEHYTRMKTVATIMDEKSVRFVVIHVSEKHPFRDKLIREVQLPMGLIMTVILRDDEALLPKGDVTIHYGDKIVIAAEAYKEDAEIELKEIEIKSEHPWVGQKIKVLNISRQTLIIYIKRRNKVIIPNGDTIIRAGDILVVYTKHGLEELLSDFQMEI